MTFARCCQNYKCHTDETVELLRMNWTSICMQSTNEIAARSKFIWSETNTQELFFLNISFIVYRKFVWYWLSGCHFRNCKCNDTQNSKSNLILRQFQIQVRIISAGFIFRQQTLNMHYSIYCSQFVLYFSINIYLLHLSVSI